MSIRSAIAGTLIDSELLDEADMFGPSGALIVDTIVGVINADSDQNTDRILAILVKHWPLRPTVDVLRQLRAAGLVIAIDDQVVNFGGR